MFSSNYISGAINNQMAQFSNMNSYSGNLSASIGMAMPPMSALGFSYGNLHDPYGQQSAAQFGSGAVGAIGSAAQTVPSMLSTIGMGAGLMSMVGLGGAAAQRMSYLDPFTGVLGGIGKGARIASGAAKGSGFFSAAGAALRGGTFGRFLAGGMAGGALAALPYYAAAKTAQVVGGNIIQGAQQDYAVHQSLQSNFDFYNPQSRTGRGFSVDQRDQISNMMRGMAESDPFTSMGELSRVMTQAAKGNLFQGVNSAREFGKKFKQLTDTLKETAKVLGTSMEGAMSFFDASKRMGFYNKVDILRNAQNATVMAGGGLSSRGIMQAQAQGAALSRAQGYTGAQGAILARKSVQGARDMLMGGFMSEADLGEMTGGLRGEQAYRMLGRQMQQASYSLARSGVGRAVYAALAQTSGEGGDTRFTGRLDKTLLQQFRSGQLSSGDIRRLASQKLMSAGTDTKLSFLNMEKDIAGSFAAGAGAQGWMGVINMVKSQRPGMSDQKVKLLMKSMTGLGRRQIDYIMKLYEKQDEVNNRNANRAADLLRKRAEQADLKMNHTFGGLMRQMSHGVAQWTTMPLQRAGANLARELRDFGQGIRDGLLGRRVTAGLDGGVQDQITGMALGDNRSLNQFNMYSGMSTSGNLDLRSGILTRMLGYGSSQAAARSMGGFLDIAGRGSMGASTVTMASGTYDQKRLAGIAEVMRQSRDQSDSFFKKHEDSVNVVKGMMKGLTARQLFALEDISGDSSRSAFRNRTEALAGMLSRHNKGAVFQSLTMKTARDLANRFGMNYDTLDRDQRVSFQSLAQQTIIGHAREKGGDIEKVLGEGGAGLIDGNLMMSGQRLAQMRSKADTALAKSLGGGRFGSLAGGLVGAGVGAEIGGLFGGVVGALGGALVGGIAGTVIGSYRSVRGLGREVQGALKDPTQRRQIMEMLTGGEAAIKKVRSQYGEGSDMRAIARRIANMSSEERDKLAKQGGLSEYLRFMEGSTVAAKQYREAGSGLLGISDADLEENLGGLSGQVRALQKSLRGAKSGLGLRGSVQDILSKRAALAKGLAGLSGKRLAQARATLGKTAEGRLALANRMLYSSRTEKALEGALGADTSEKFLAQLKGLGFGTGTEGSMFRKKLLEARDKGDLGELQKTLLASKLTKKEDALSVLTTMKGGIEKMAKTSEKLLDVMLTVHADKDGVKAIKKSVDKMRGVPKRLQK